jgi:Domain of unknown function (DUF1906)/LysM domain
MTETGLDRAEAPAVDLCVKAAQDAGASWWNVYIGGDAFLAASGWTPALVQSMARLGLKFMATYVGQQAGGNLTRQQGSGDGADAIAAMVAFGWQPGNPCCLDIECATYWSAPQGAIEYATSWCAAVRAGGYRPGVYSCPVGLIALAAHGGLSLPDFVWLGSLVANVPTRLDPHQAAGLPDALWPGDGQRIWQYAGRGAIAAGMEVGISVSDPGCLAGGPDLIPASEGDLPAGMTKPLPEAGLHPDVSMSLIDSALSQALRAPADTYVVRAGDSLASIADAHGMTWRKLWALNRDRIANPNLISPGERLRVG